MAKKIGFFPDIEIPTSWDAVIIEAVQIESIEKPLASRERNSLLCIIAALCKEHKIDYEKAAKSVGLIEVLAAA